MSGRGNRRAAEAGLQIEVQGRPVGRVGGRPCVHLPPEPAGPGQAPRCWPDGPPAALCCHACSVGRTVGSLETVETQDHHLGPKQLLGSLADSTPK